MIFPRLKPSMENQKRRCGPKRSLVFNEREE